MSRYRSGLLIAREVTRNEQTARQLHLHRACYPVWYPEPRGIESHQWQTDVSAVFFRGRKQTGVDAFSCRKVDNRIRYGLRAGLKLNLIQTGSTIVAVQGWKGGLGHTNTMRILSVPNDPADLELQALVGV